ncbi:MAG: hypothetical protein ACE5ER_06155 [Nitrospinaceae bacterium]
MRNESSRVRRFLKILVMLNLIALVGFFLIPRSLYLWTHRDMTPERFLQTPGTYDLPNLYWQSFRLAYSIQRETPPGATVFLPPAHREYPAPSALIRVLLPRRLVFGRTPEFRRMVDAAPLLHQAWFVAGPGWFPRRCEGKPGRRLGESGYIICRLDEKPG